MIITKFILGSCFLELIRVLFRQEKFEILISSRALVILDTSFTSFSYAQFIQYHFRFRIASPYTNNHYVVLKAFLSKCHSKSLHIH